MSSDRNTSPQENTPPPKHKWWKRQSSDEGADRDEGNIRDFFSDSDQMHITQRKSFAILAAMSVGLYVAYLAVLLLPKTANWLADSHRQGISVAINSVTGIFIAALVSVLVVIFINHANLKRLDSVKDLARKDILQSLFHILRGYDRRYSEMKKIYFELGEPVIAADGFIAARCRIKTIQSFRPNGDVLSFGFQTLNRRVPNDSKVVVPLLGRNGLDELYSIDTTDILDHFGETHKAGEWFRGLTEVYINNSPVKVTPQSPDKAGNFQRCGIDISQERVNRDSLDLTYVYEFAIEIPGHFFFEAREPTRGFLCQIDYTKAAHLMNCYSIETFHSTTHQHDISNDVDGIITISTREWVFPRSSAVFCWYKKSEQATTQQPMAIDPKVTAAPPGANPVVNTQTNETTVEGGHAGP